MLKFVKNFLENLQRKMKRASEKDDDFGRRFCFKVTALFFLQKFIYFYLRVVFSVVLPIFALF